MWVSGPFQVTEDDVERSSTLDNKDVGQWAYVANGCINVVGSYNDAMEVVELLQGRGSIRQWLRDAR